VEAENQPDETVLESTRRLGHLLTLAAVALALLITAARAPSTNDLSIYIAMGRWMLENGALYEVDTFTYTLEGTRFVNGTWGFSLLMGVLHTAVGYEGIRLLNGLWVAGLCWLVSHVCSRAGADPRAGAFAALYTFVMLLQNVSPRGQTLVFGAFIGLVWLLAKPRSARDAFLGALALSIPWGWIHGSFAAGGVYAALVGAGRLLDTRDWRAVIVPVCVGLGIVVGASLGPYGPEIWGYVFANSSLPVERHLSEWAPPQWGTAKGTRFFLASALWIVLLARGRKRLTWEGWLPVLAFAYLASTGTRFIAWWGLASVVPLARWLSVGMKAPKPLPARVERAMLPVAAVFFTALCLKGIPSHEGLEPSTPVALTDTLRDTKTPGRVFAPMAFGGYLAEQLGSEWRTHLDMRVWIFPDPEWEEFLSIAQAEAGWQAKLDAHETTHLLLTPEHVGHALLDAARTDSGWSLLAEDETGALFERAPVEPQRVPAEPEISE